MVVWLAMLPDLQPEQLADDIVDCCSRHIPLPDLAAAGQTMRLRGPAPQAPDGPVEMLGGL